MTPEISPVEFAARRDRAAAMAAEAGLSKQEALAYPNDDVVSGLGWDAPRVTPSDDMVLQPGMVLCLERTIRKDGCLGEFDETVVVTEDGCEKITDAKVRW